MTDKNQQDGSGSSQENNSGSGAGSQSGQQGDSTNQSGQQGSQGQEPKGPDRGSKLGDSEYKADKELLRKK